MKQLREIFRALPFAGHESSATAVAEAFDPIFNGEPIPPGKAGLAFRLLEAVIALAKADDKAVTKAAAAKAEAAMAKPPKAAV